MVEIVFINRWKHDDCTIGRLTYNDFQCLALELPWRENQQNISCIPYGNYDCEKYMSGTHGECIAVLDVEDRTHIRIHKGNFTHQILGCILVGDGIKDINRDGVPDVINSAKTLKELLSVLPDKFKLCIY